MKKVLFVGIERFFLRKLLGSLPEKKLVRIHDLQTMTPQEALEIANDHHDICLVIFAGCLVTDRPCDSLRANVGLVIELRKVLLDARFVAATGDLATNIELHQNGCQIVISKGEIRCWLQKNI